MVEQRITAIRTAIPGAGRYFTEGGCYDFACLMRFLYPDTELWFMYWGKGEPGVVEHVITKIGDLFYDINGIFIPQPGQSVARLEGTFLETARKFRYETGD